MTWSNLLCWVNTLLLVVCFSTVAHAQSDKEQHGRELRVGQSADVNDIAVPDELASIMPPAIRLTHISYVSGSMTITGESPSNILVAKLVMNMEDSADYNNVTLKELNLGNAGEEKSIKFTISCQFQETIKASFKKPAVKLTANTVEGKDDKLQKLNDKLISSIRKKDFVTVKSVLAKGADINSRDRYGRTALLGAVRARNIDIAYFLLANGADVNIKDNKGKTALIYAVLSSSSNSGDIDLSKALLAKGADVNSRDHDGMTALMAAAQAGKKEIVSALLEEGSDPNAISIDGRTALTMALMERFGDFLERQASVVKVILERDVDVNVKLSDGSTALMLAAERGMVETVRSLLAKGADPHVVAISGYTALFVAAAPGYLFPVASGHAEIAEILLSEGVDVNIKVNTKRGNGYTALMGASELGGTVIVKVLLEKGADPSATTSDGKTAMFYAVDRNYKDIVKMLLEKGVDPNVKTPSGTTMLFHAEVMSHEEAARLLRDHGAAEPDPEEVGKAKVIHFCGGVKADLLNFAMEQDIYSVDYATYADDLSKLRDFRVRNDSKITVIHADEKYFQATGSHPECPDVVEYDSRKGSREEWRLKWRSEYLESIKGK